MRMDFPADLSAPSNARMFVSEQLHLLSGATTPWPTDDVVLVASELVTNSVQAGAQKISVQIQVHDDRIQLQVTDDAEGVPSRLDAQPHDVAGRGLALTEKLADDWTVSGSHPFKVVTASWLHP